MLAWYALNTKPLAEARVARALIVREFEVFLPFLPQRPSERNQPLFPAYLFMHCDLETIGVSRLQWIPGLRRIVGFNGRPTVVPDAAITLIQTRLREIETQGGLPSHNFQPGDTVVIDDGPLAGLRGIFQGPTGPAERVRILIHFLGQANRAEVPVSALRPAPDEPPEPLRRRSTRGHGRRIHYDAQPENTSGTGAKPIY